MNCMANAKKSTSNFQGTAGQADNKAYLIGHFMREFDAKTVFPDNKDSEDIVISYEKFLKADLVFAFSGQDDIKKAAVELKMLEPMGDKKDTLSCEGRSNTTAAQYLQAFSKISLVSFALLAINMVI